MIYVLVIVFGGGGAPLTQLDAGELKTEELCMAAGRGIAEQMIDEVPGLTVVWGCTPGIRT